MYLSTAEHLATPQEPPPVVRVHARVGIPGAVFLTAPASSSAFPLFAAIPHSHPAVLSPKLVPAKRTRDAHWGRGE
jgi:hypothetical protein